jgi:hypothetical protein
MPVWEAIAGAASSIGGAIFGNRAKRKAEERSRQWELDMYNRKYKDNLNLWRMQNAYNTPQAQMGRLKRAGLNPMLMYGKGGSGGGQAGPLSTPDTEKPDFRVPEWQGAAGALSEYMDLRIKQAQTNNLETQNTNAINQEARAADEYGTVGGNVQSPSGTPLMGRHTRKYRNWQQSNMLRHQADAMQAKTFIDKIQGSVLDKFMMKKYAAETLSAQELAQLRQMERKWFKGLGLAGRYAALGLKFAK